ncbi:MAG: hypothetical protein EZS28_011057, partial [Streblomastix strix]
MKFSRQLTYLQVPKWKHQYIDYRALKRSMKVILAPYINRRIAVNVPNNIMNKSYPARSTSFSHISTATLQLRTSAAKTDSESVLPVIQPPQQVYITEGEVSQPTFPDFTTFSAQSLPQQPIQIRSPTIKISQPTQMLTMSLGSFSNPYLSSDS